ncbi:MAG: hypothetical protein HOH33_00635 [Verrucomicrobia bacterium]|jgi:hypothetical protein|nr:hypothetical protein [Verrucomicrobiota bacterium]
MNTNKTNLCRRCEAPIPADSTDRICPACLMSGALEIPTETTIATESSTLSKSPAFPHPFHKS